MNDPKNTPEEEYVPISCSIHDKLEETAVRRTVAHFVLRGEDGESMELQDRIEDVFARDGVEYMKTEGGEEIRLDRIESVNGERVTVQTPGS